MIRHASSIYFLGLVFFALQTSAGADYDYQFDTRMVQQGQYESEVTAKFTRGITNIAFGWTEMMRTPVEMSRDPEVGAIQSTLLGLPWGIVRFVGRTLVGVYEVITCMAPQPPIFSELTGDVL